MAVEPSSEVEHRAERSQFVIDSAAGQAHVDYRIDGDQLSVLSTFVPPALRGRGVAARLTEAVLAYCRQQGFALYPRCSYTVSYLKQHPQDGLQIRGLG